jgi:hypothetical protein
MHDFRKENVKEIKKLLKKVCAFYSNTHNEIMPTQSRIRFPGGKQKSFLDSAIARCGSVIILAEFLAISPRTVRDWRREKFLMSYAAAINIGEAYDIPLPNDGVIEDEFWYVKKGARAGGLASFAKQGGQIGDPVVRKEKWLEWWERTGKANSHFPFHPLPFTKPEKSEKLAEFIGIMMGDGGMTKAQATITLHHIDDLEYSDFVMSLIAELFGVTPTITHRPKESVNIIRISRVGIINHLHELGLPIGNKIKQSFDIPIWIKENGKYMTNCIRGLVDTDGSIFTHTYFSSKKFYSYKKLSFASASPPLRESVLAFFRNSDLYARITRGIDVRIESKIGIQKYMNLIGTHNPKHLKRYLN